MNLPYVPEKITVTKLDVVRRQLDTAITLWFANADPISIHTLASTSHEILHILYKRKGLNGLLFDAPIVKDEHRSKWAYHLTKHYTFFKHARADADRSIEFQPEVNEFLIYFSIHGLTEMKEPLTTLQEAFKNWHFINRPEFLIEGAYERLKVDTLDEMRALNKQQFLHQFLMAWDAIHTAN